MKKEQSQAGRIFILLIIVVAAFFLVEHFHIKNFHIVEPEVLYISGQPRGMDYTRLLYKYHIATIVNVRSATEHREKNWYNEEINWIRNNGVKYFELPVGRVDYFPDGKTQDKFIEIMDNRENLPVLLHGSSGETRAPMLTAVWLIKNKGLSTEETLKIVDKINDDRRVSEAEKKFISQLAN